jgi:hypothetical protein
MVAGVLMALGITFIIAGLAGLLLRLVDRRPKDQEGPRTPPSQP